MHELSIAQALIEQVEGLVERERASGVVTVTVAVGALSGVDPEALEAAFPVAAEGTACDGAALVIRAVESKVYCRACVRETAAEFPFGVCGECGSGDVDVRSGRELMLESLELK